MAARRRRAVLLLPWLALLDHGSVPRPPVERAKSRLKEQVCLYSNSVVARNGILHGYLGPGAPPLLPDECMRAPDAYTFAFNTPWERKWLQALEVRIDPAQNFHLYRFVVDDYARDIYGKEFRSVSIGGNVPLTKIMRDYVTPNIDLEHTTYGLRIASRRRLGEGGEVMHVRIIYEVFSQGIMIPLIPTMAISQWHIPLDDTSCYWYPIFTNFDAPWKRRRCPASESPK
jgi:phthalate 4,5-dioxygenase oxygenase subunit